MAGAGQVQLGHHHLHLAIGQAALQRRVALRDGRVLLRRCMPTQQAGRPVRVWGFRDITVEARAQAGLRAAEAQQRALLAAFPGHIACIDVSLRYTYVNARLAELLETTPQALVGRSVADVAGTAHAPRLMHRIARALDGEVQHFERQHPATATRPAVHLLVTLARGVDRATGQVLCYAFGTDISAQKRTEAALLAAKDEAERASRAKSVFLSRMSDELRTPMNAVLGMAELLAVTPLDTRQRRLVAQVRTAGRTLAALIGDVLDLSRIEAGHLAVTMAPFSLRAMVDEAVGLFEDEARSRGLQLQVQVDAAVPERVLGDALRTRQILVNLLSNAMKFTRRGQVAVSVTPTDDGVRIAVADTGEGIDPAVLPYIYDAFRQGDGSSPRRFGGAGLGLTIARHLCQLLGGHIDVASRPGQGSTFWFALPLQAVALAPPGPPELSPRPAPGAVPVALPPGLRVLLIEDDPASRDLVQQHLAHAGLQLTTGQDGLAGIALLREQPYDVVLLDWQLPGIDGLAVLAMLRALEDATGRPRAQVITVTAHASAGDRETCLAAGADDYLAKPFDSATLLAHLAAACHRLTGAASGAAG